MNQTILDMDLDIAILEAKLNIINDIKVLQQDVISQLSLIQEMFEKAEDILDQEEKIKTYKYCLIFLSDLDIRILSLKTMLEKVEN
jgi:hypothetical protein